VGCSVRKLVDGDQDQGADRLFPRTASCWRLAVRTLRFSYGRLPQGKLSLSCTDMKGRSQPLLFSPDGQVLVSGSRDHTTLLSGMSGCRACSRSARGANWRTPSASDLWPSLSENDARAAHQALARLAGDPAGSVDFVTQQLPACRHASRGTDSRSGWPASMQRSLPAVNRRWPSCASWAGLWSLRCARR